MPKPGENKTIQSRDESIQRLLKSFEEDNQQRHQRLLDYIQSLRSEVNTSGETGFTRLLGKRKAQSL